MKKEGGLKMNAGLLLETHEVKVQATRACGKGANPCMPTYTNTAFHARTHNSNIGLAGGAPMCESLLNAGVLPAAAALLRRSIEGLSSLPVQKDAALTPAEKRAKEQFVSAAESSLNLIWLLWCVRMQIFVC